MSFYASRYVWSHGSSWNNFPLRVGEMTLGDQIGRFMAWMEGQVLLKGTLVVFTSDRGDYPGDPWLGEKELFQDLSARVPMIVVDPSAEADETRGHVQDHLVEAIDLAPTFVDWFGGAPRLHILEGRSLLPLLRGSPSEWRDCAFSEYG